MFQSLCYYTLANPEVPANIFQEIARWTAPLATVSWVYLGITRIWRKLNNFTTFRKGNSVAVYGDPEQTAVLLEQLGDRGIAGEDEFVEAQQYIFADTEKENFNRYQHMKQQIKDRKVCIRVDDVHGRESGRNMILYNDKATAAVKYWQKNLLYDDVCQTDFTGDVVILGFGNMEKELLINALQLNVFDQKQKITYHVFEDTGRNELLTSLKAELFQNGYLSGSKVSGEEFQKVYHEIDQIPDPVIFHKDPWYDNLDLLADAERIIIFDDVQLALKVMFAIPKVKIHLLSDRKEEIATIENSNRVVVFDWRREGQNVEDILKEHNFPMQRKELLCKMLERLGLRCNENFFAQHINNPLDGFKYHKMEKRNAYCINGWAEDDENRLENELLQAVITILQRENKPIATKELLEMVVCEQPKFRDFFAPNDADAATLNGLMTPEVLNANDITLVSQHPMTYRYHN